MLPQTRADGGEKETLGAMEYPVLCVSSGTKVGIVNDARDPRVKAVASWCCQHKRRITIILATVVDWICFICSGDEEASDVGKSLIWTPHYRDDKNEQSTASQREQEGNISSTGCF